MPGTSARVFGSLLNWLQDKESQVFVIATANDVTQLPPELLRKGRWDEVFYCDLPTAPEREAIWRIHRTHKQRKPEALFRCLLGQPAEVAYADPHGYPWNCRRKNSPRCTCGWRAAGATEQRLVRRARVILDFAAGAP